MQWLGYLIFAVALGLTVWFLIDTIKVAKERIKKIKEQRAKKKNVSNGEVQAEINKDKENTKQ